MVVPLARARQRAIYRHGYRGFAFLARRTLCRHERLSNVPASATESGATAPPPWSSARHFSRCETWRGGAESNRRIELLQSSALPLGYRTGANERGTWVNFRASARTEIPRRNRPFPRRKWPQKSTKHAKILDGVNRPDAVLLTGRD